VTPPSVAVRRPPVRADLVRWIGVAVAVLAVSVGVLVARGWRLEAGASRPATVAAAGMPTSVELEDTYGIRVVGVDLTGSDGMLQLRYQVLDADKAHAVHDEATAPVVIVDGRTLAEPGIAGHGGHKVAVDAGAAGVVLLANTDHAVARGDVVTLRMGDLRLDGIQVD
jgi:hypothetical protein